MRLKSLSTYILDLILDRIVAKWYSNQVVFSIWLHGQAVKTSPFHGGNTGSIPVGVIHFLSESRKGYGPLAQLVRATGS